MNADLSNELGNLAQRSLTMVAKNCDAQVPTPGEFTEDDLAMLASADALLAKCRSEFDVQALHLALEAIWGVLGETNRYFSKQEPWVLRKTDPARMATVLYVTIEVVRIVGLLVQPSCPTRRHASSIYSVRAKRTVSSPTSRFASTRTGNCLLRHRSSPASSRNDLGTSAARGSEISVYRRMCRPTCTLQP